MPKLTLKHSACPRCPSSDAYCEYEDGHGYCYSCNTYFRNKESFESVSYTYEYLPLRGLTKDTLAFYDVKTKIGPNGEPLSIGFKYPNNSLKIRSLEKKDFYTEGDIAKAGLFGRNKFAAGSHKSVTITEGELDALSLYQVLKGPVVSVQSSGSAVRDCTLDRSWLNSFERVYIAFDGDTAGRTAADAVAKLFDYAKVFQVKFSNRKDANEYLEAGEQDDLRNIWWNSKKYQPESIISGLDDFEKILKEPPKRGVPYPFPTLTDMTYGIRTGESVLITAQEGVGKTEIMHAIEHQLLTETQDNVGAIFLEEPKARHLQAIAGLELKRPVHLPDSGYSVSEVFTALSKVVQTDDRLHLYSHFGSDDPEHILDTIRFLVCARGCRYVLLDHITMVVSGLGGEDERRALDQITTRLEMMVKELDFSLIFVSHVNDYDQTRGSRNISKVADVRIDAKRDLLSPDPIERLTIRLQISKNRPASKTGPAGSLIFNPIEYTLSEVNPSGDQHGSPISG